MNVTAATMGLSPHAARDIDGGDARGFLHAEEGTLKETQIQTCARQLPYGRVGLTVDQFDLLTFKPRSMTIDEIEDHNKRHTLAVFNGYVMGLAITLGVVVVFASIFPNVTVPYLGAKIPPFLMTAIIQSTLLALLINTNNTYQYFFVMIDIDISTRWLGSLVYVAHFALVFFSIALPTHWLWRGWSVWAHSVCQSANVYHIEADPRTPIFASAASLV
jgi:hypothetical protein